MACASPWFWEKLHAAAAEHAELALEFKVPPNSRPAHDWQTMKQITPKTKASSTPSTHQDLPKADSYPSQATGKDARHDRMSKNHSATTLQGSSLGKPKPPPLSLDMDSTTSQVKGKEAKNDKNSKSHPSTLLQGSNFAKPMPPAPVNAHRPEAPVPARFQPQALGMLPKQDQRIPERQPVLNQPSMERQGRSHSSGALGNLRQEKNMKDTRNLLNALVQPPSSGACEDFAEPASVPYHMRRFGSLGDRMQVATDANVRQVLSGVASFHKPKKDAKQDIYAASTRAGSYASSLADSSKSSPRLASKSYCA
jgi:hypothetical protein